MQRAWKAPVRCLRLKKNMSGKGKSAKTFKQHDAKSIKDPVVKPTNK